MSSFVTQLASRRARNIYLVTGGHDHTGRAAWYYVQVQPAKITMFERAIAAGNLTLTDFGSIIESGYGETPPEHVRHSMKLEYDFEESAAA